MEPEASRPARPPAPHRAVERAIQAAGASVTLLPEREAWAVQRQWQAIFWAPGRAAGTRRGHDECDWHAFTWGKCPALSGGRALRAYLEQAPAGYYVWVEGRRARVYRCEGGSLPDLSPLRQDVHVFPVTLSWTMSFTHEHDLGLGPYFARSEDALPDAPEPP